MGFASSVVPLRSVRSFPISVSPPYPPKLWRPGGQEPHRTCPCVPVTPDNGPGTRSTRNHLWNERGGLFAAVSPWGTPGVPLYSENSPDSSLRG